MNEVWVGIPGFDDFYEASSLGRIRVKSRIVTKRHFNGKMITQTYPSRILSPCNTDKYGHQAVGLGPKGGRSTISVHRLVLMAFVGPCPDGMEACHGNGDATDNRPENLRWDTHTSNAQDRRDHGTYTIGEMNPLSKRTDEQVLGIRSGAISRHQAMSELGISSPTYYGIKLGRIWNHVHPVDPPPIVPRIRLSLADVQKIEDRLAKGEAQTSIASAFGVSQSCISDIKLGKHHLSHSPDRTGKDQEAA